ncbi:MAG: hypothetical protein QM756_13240 [Polyangiaceae bacterium]
MALRLLCLTLLLTACGASVRDAIFPPDFGSGVDADESVPLGTTFMGHGAGVRRIDAEPR